MKEKIGRIVIDEWKSACEYAGIKYSDYDNQDEMWEDLQYKLMILDVDNEFDEFIKRAERAYWEQGYLNGRVRCLPRKR